MVAGQGRAIAGLWSLWPRTGAQCAAACWCSSHITLCHAAVTRSRLRMLSRYKVECYNCYTLCQSLHHPSSRYRVTGIIWTRGHCRQLRHKAVCRSEGWRTKRSSDYVKLSTVCCCCWLRPGLPHALIHQGWISGCLKERSKGPQKRTQRHLNISRKVYKNMKSLLNIKKHTVTRHYKYNIAIG